MIALEEALARVNKALTVLPTEEVALGEALGMVLAETVVADEALPPFSNTAMDGFAIKAADSVGASELSPVTLPVVATVPAGSVAPRALASGEAMRIMTGAPIPDGADAIIMVELTRPAGFNVDLLAEVPKNNHIRPAGDDVQLGAEIFSSGTKLGAGHLGVLASLGRQSVRAYRRPRVGVMSTGDELVEGPDPLQPGQIRDSNRITLLSLVKGAGLTPIDLGLIPDDEQQIREALQLGITSCDAVITSGGVSMGDFDYVKAVLTDLGDFSWMQVAIKPAKPLVFGVLEATPIFGLPGNPVSSMVSFELFARPGLRRMMGLTDAERTQVTAVATEPLGRSEDGKTHFLRVLASVDQSGKWGVRLAGAQGSHQLTGMASANALAILPDGPGAETGDLIRVMLLSSPQTADRDASGSTTLG